MKTPQNVGKFAVAVRRKHRRDFDARNSCNLIATVLLFGLKRTEVTDLQLRHLQYEDGNFEGIDLQGSNPRFIPAYRIASRRIIQNQNDLLVLHNLPTAPDSFLFPTPRGEQFTPSTFTRHITNKLGKIKIAMRLEEVRQVGIRSYYAFCHSEAETARFAGVDAGELNGILQNSIPVAGVFNPNSGARMKFTATRIDQFVRYLRSPSAHSRMKALEHLDQVDVENEAQAEILVRACKKVPEFDDEHFAILEDLLEDLLEISPEDFPQLSTP